MKADTRRKHSGSPQTAELQKGSDHGRGPIPDLSQNRVLAELSEGEIDRLKPHFRYVQLHDRQMLRTENEPMVHVYFPTSGMISSVVVMANGFTIEVSIVGREGMLGASMLLGYDGAPGSVSFVQVRGAAFRIKASDCRSAFDGKGRLQPIVHRYLGAQWAQLARSAACNRLHTQSQRFARRLLMAMDRVGPEFRMTHELLAETLGSRRPTVTVEAQKLQEAGIIEYRRGTMKILKRKSLEQIACECYRRTDLDGFLKDS